MTKYTPANALAIKRDVQRHQQLLADILKEIEIKKADLVEIEKQKGFAVVDVARRNNSRVLQILDNAFVPVFNKKKKELASYEKREKLMKLSLEHLEHARDLIDVEISLKKNIKVADPSSYLESLIGNLGNTLSRLLSQIDVKEGELNALDLQKAEFEAGNAKLNVIRTEQEGKVMVAKQELEDISDEREMALETYARESKKLTQIKDREHDVKVMEFRLSEEYQKVYQSLPRRGKK